LEGAFSRGEVFLRFRVDELDDLAFPHSGSAVRVQLGAGVAALGSDVAYEQSVVEGLLAQSHGHNTFLVDGLFATTRDSDAPLQSLFSLGGFQRLSGLQQDQLLGQHAALLAGSFYREFGRSRWWTLYAGVSGEYGNVFQEKRQIRLDEGLVAGSAFLGVDSPLGPILLAFGMTEGGRRNFYFSLGQPLAQRRPEIQQW
jgi:NTE family protein